MPVHTSNAAVHARLEVSQRLSPTSSRWPHYLTQARDGFVNVAEDAGRLQPAVRIRCRSDRLPSGPRSGGTRSVVLTMWQYVGGTHPQTWYKSFNWTVAEKAPITFDTLFKPGTKPLDVIYPAVDQYLQKQTGTDRPLPPSAGSIRRNYQNFALTDDSLIFFFGQGEMFARSAGVRLRGVAAGRRATRSRR